MALYWPQGWYHQIWEANLQPLGPKNRPKDAQSWPQVWWVLAGLFTLTGPKNSRRWRRVCFPPRSAIFRSRMGCVHPCQTAPSFRLVVMYGNYLGPVVCKIILMLSSPSSCQVRCIIIISWIVCHSRTWAPRSKSCCFFSWTQFINSIKSSNQN